MPCKCKQKQAETVTVMSGGYESPTLYIITPSTDELEQAVTVTSSGTAFYVQRGGVTRLVAPNKFFAFKESEVSQLLEQEAPIYVFR